jgi:hypothetical protein
VDYALKTSSFTLDDNDCIQSKFGTTDARSLSSSTCRTFTPSTHYPNGVLPKGTVLALRTSDSVTIAYNDAGSGGAAVAVGVLLNSIRVSASGATAAAKVGGALMWHGVLKAASAPFQSGVGGLDAAAKVDLAAKFQFV